MGYGNVLHIVIPETLFTVEYAVAFSAGSRVVVCHALIALRCHGVNPTGIFFDDII